MNDIEYEQRAKKYILGKTFKDQEFGVKYPDGTIRWQSPNMFNDPDYSKQEGRVIAQERYDNDMSNLHMPTSKLVFLQREITTKFSEPVVLN